MVGRFFLFLLKHTPEQTELAKNSLDLSYTKAWFPTSPDTDSGLSGQARGLEFWIVLGIRYYFIIQGRGALAVTFDNGTHNIPRSAQSPAMASSSQHVARLRDCGLRRVFHVSAADHHGSLHYGGNLSWVQGAVILSIKTIFLWLWKEFGYKSTCREVAASKLDGECRTGASELNNYLQGRKLAWALSWIDTPSGAKNAPTWTSVCKIAGVEFGTGTGNQKHVARDNAANAALIILRQQDT